MFPKFTADMLWLVASGSGQRVADVESRDPRSHHNYPHVCAHYRELGCRGETFRKRQ